uniref:Uncharacterized protein n=1 Tax=Chenopodium quinoa TaxID=63459 RepID=A0A803M239_CHEQI
MAYLVRNLKLLITKIPSSNSSSSQIFRGVTNLQSSASPINTFRCLNTFRSSTCSFRSFGSAASESDNDMVNHQGFQMWSNGGGLFHTSACIDPTVVVETGAVVHPKATLGANVHVGSGAVIGPSVTVGHCTTLGYNVALSNCSIGDLCVIHSGVCIGQDGFGFFVDEHGNMAKKSQIGHNAIIGKSCILCGQVGIAGSVTVAVRDHVSIVSKVRLAAISCVTKDIKEPGDYGGFPAVPVQQWRRQLASQRWNCKDIKSS